MRPPPTLSLVRQVGGGGSSNGDGAAQLTVKTHSTSVKRPGSEILSIVATTQFWSGASASTGRPAAGW